MPPAMIGTHLPIMHRQCRKTKTTRNAPNAGPDIVRPEDPGTLEHVRNPEVKILHNPTAGHCLIHTQEPLPQTACSIPAGSDAAR